MIDWRKNRSETNGANSSFLAMHSHCGDNALDIRVTYVLLHTAVLKKTDRIYARAVRVRACVVGRL